MSEQKKGGGCPMNPYGASDLTYDNYLKIPEICSLQIPKSDPVHHDEILFIIIHQTYELWFKLILHELDSAMALMVKGEVLSAQHFVKRVVEIMRLLVPQIHLLETMRPTDFLDFRGQINPASGFQSSQFREVEFVAGLKDERYLGYFKNKPEMVERLQKRMDQIDLRQAYYQMLQHLGFKLPAKMDFDAVVQAILPVYLEPAKNLPLYLLSESLMDFDEYLGLWREHHVRVVERIIGFRTGTGGSSGVEYLKSTTSKKAFPFLWDVRNFLKKD